MARRIVLTKHAADMLVERDIDPDWVERTLTDPEDTEPDPNRPDTFRAFRAIPERDGRILRVVYTLENDQMKVITAFFDRARRP